MPWTFECRAEITQYRHSDATLALPSEGVTPEYPHRLLLSVDLVPREGSFTSACYRGRFTVTREQSAERTDVRTLTMGARMDAETAYPPDEMVEYYHLDLTDGHLSISNEGDRPDWLHGELTCSVRVELRYDHPATIRNANSLTELANDRGDWQWGATPGDAQVETPGRIDTVEDAASIQLEDSTGHLEYPREHLPHYWVFEDAHFQVALSAGSDDERFTDQLDDDQPTATEFDAEVTARDGDQVTLEVTAVETGSVGHLTIDADRLPPELQTVGDTGSTSIYLEYDDEATPDAAKPTTEDDIAALDIPDHLRLEDEPFPIDEPS